MLHFLQDVPAERFKHRGGALRPFTLHSASGAQLMCAAHATIQQSNYTLMHLKFAFPLPSVVVTPHHGLEHFAGCTAQWGGYSKLQIQL